MRGLPRRHISGRPNAALVGSAAPVMAPATVSADVSDPLSRVPTPVQVARPPPRAVSSNHCTYPRRVRESVAQGQQDCDHQVEDPQPRGRRCLSRVSHRYRRHVGRASHGRESPYGIEMGTSSKPRVSIWAMAGSGGPEKTACRAKWAATLMTAASTYLPSPLPAQGDETLLRLIPIDRHTIFMSSHSTKAHRALQSATGVVVRRYAVQGTHL